MARMKMARLACLLCPVLSTRVSLSDDMLAETVSGADNGGHVSEVSGSAVDSLHRRISLASNLSSHMDPFVFIGANVETRTTAQRGNGGIRPNRCPEQYKIPKQLKTRFEKGFLRNWCRGPMGMYPDYGATDPKNVSLEVQGAACKSATWASNAVMDLLMHHEPVENEYKKMNNVGGWGGTCTCPDGEVFNVGDMMGGSTGCESLACEGGVSGPCGDHIPAEAAGHGARCASGESSGLHVEIPHGDGMVLYRVTKTISGGPGGLGINNGGVYEITKVVNTRSSASLPEKLALKVPKSPDKGGNEQEFQTEISCLRASAGLVGVSKLYATSFKLPEGDTCHKAIVLDLIDGKPWAKELSLSKEDECILQESAFKLMCGMTHPKRHTVNMDLNNPGNWMMLKGVHSKDRFVNIDLGLCYQPKPAKGTTIEGSAEDMLAKSPEGAEDLEDFMWRNEKVPGIFLSMSDLVLNSQKRIDWADPIVNLYQKVPNVGGWGGTCTCPDGEVFYVGDVMGGNGCDRLSCEGGVPGPCGPNIPPEASGFGAKCAPPGAAARAAMADARRDAVKLDDLINRVSNIEAHVTKSCAWNSPAKFMVAFLSCVWWLSAS